MKIRFFDGFKEVGGAIGILMDVYGMGALCWYWLTRSTRMHVLAIIALLISGILFMILLYHWAFSTLSRLRSGISGFFTRYTVADNIKNWNSVKREYRYVGISFRTLRTEFKEYLDALADSDARHFQILLLKPGSPVIKQQVYHRYGVIAGEIPEYLKEIIEEEIKLHDKNVQLTLDELKQTPVFKKGHLKIRFYDEYLNSWMEIIDERYVFLGLLLKGQTSQNGPVLLLKNHQRRFIRSHAPTMFQVYLDAWNRLWDNAEPIE